MVFDIPTAKVIFYREYQYQFFIIFAVQKDYKDCS